MILCHVIDEFVLQPIYLSKIKQKSWWEDNISSEKNKNDYKMALFMHCLCWSAMILLPVLFFVEISGMWIYWIYIINAFIYYIIDDLKTNYNFFNLVQSQAIHLGQILLTFLAIILILY